MVNNGLPILENDGNDVETGVGIDVVLENIGIGGIDKTRLLLPRNSKIGLAIVVVLPRLHLHNDQLLAIFCNDINLLVVITPITFEDLVAFPFQVLGRKLFALFA